MIEYRILTKKDMPAWRKKYNLLPHDVDPTLVNNIPRAGIQNAVVSPDFDCFQNIDPDMVCAIVALEGDRLIGKLLILYTDLLINNRLQRCAIGSGFYVLNEYRDRAVGIAIMLKALKLGVPYLEAGVSGQMRNILNSWKQFTQIDESPEFQVALDKAGLIQITKWDFYAHKYAATFPINQLIKIALLFRNLSNKWRLNATRYTRISAIPVNQAINQYLGRYFSSPKYPIQIPWNNALINEALAGKNPNCKAWIVEDTKSNSGPWLISMYRRERHLGTTSDGTPKKLREIYLNEIYPPLDQDDPIDALLAFSLHQATTMDANILRIYALTPAMADGCRRFGLSNRASKSIFVAPGTNIDETTTKYLCDPKSWWCRAFSEDQFEESFKNDEEVLEASLLR